MKTDFPLLVDVDTGVDDAIALALATSLSDNLVGVTTVAGNVPITYGTPNTRNVLSHLGREDVPVHSGASRPLVAEYVDATHVHGGNGLGGVELPASRRPLDSLPGPGFIIQTAEKYASELVIVTLGPLTNLAIAINVRPEVIEQVARVVVMGGAFHVAGNVTPASEFNIHVDPEAAQQVFDAPWKDITLIGLDVTHQTALARDHWEAIPEDASGAPWLVKAVMERSFTERNLTGFYLHDPLAIGVAFDSSLVNGERRAVSVGLSGEDRGRTVTREAGTPLIATSVDTERFLGMLGRALELPELQPGLGHERAE